VPVLLKVVDGLLEVVNSVGFVAQFLEAARDLEGDGRLLLQRAFQMRVLHQVGLDEAVERQLVLLQVRLDETELVVDVFRQELRLHVDHLR